MLSAAAKRRKPCGDNFRQELDVSLDGNSTSRQSPSSSLGLNLEAMETWRSLKRWRDFGGRKASVSSISWMFVHLLRSQLLDLQQVVFQVSLDMSRCHCKGLSSKRLLRQGKAEAKERVEEKSRWEATKVISSIGSLSSREGESKVTFCFLEKFSKDAILEMLSLSLLRAD